MGDDGHCGDGEGADAKVVDQQVAVSERHAARLSGFSVRRLRAWADRGLARPSIERRLSERNVVRLYAFGDLVELLVGRVLVDAGRSPQQIRRVVEYLRSYEAPLCELRFAVSGQEIYFQHPDGSWEGDGTPARVEVLDLDAIKAQIRHSVCPEREKDAGQVERRRGVLGSKPVFAGTRIPVAAVQTYIARDLSDELILEAFPELTRKDLESARRFSANGLSLLEPCVDAYPS